MTTITSKGIFDPRTGAGGWAAYVDNIAKREHRGFSGPLVAAGASEAEFGAMRMALSRGIDNGLISSMSRVEIRTNCRECIAILLAMVPSSRCIGETVIEPAKKITGRLSGSEAVVGIVQFVKAHSLAIVFHLVKIDKAVVQGAWTAMDTERRQCA